VPEEPGDKPERPSIEAEFAGLVQNIDLYVRQKTDLYVQHYLLDPLDFILRQVIYLSVVAALLVVGTLAIAVGVILFVSTLIPLWSALLLCGVAALLFAGICAYIMFARRLILKTPRTRETGG
jgi:hypothetical protein